MTGYDIVAVVLICLILGGALFYIIKEKRKGAKCIGCPYAKSCGKSCSESKCSCKSKSEKTDKNTEYYV